MATKYTKLIAKKAKQIKLTNFSYDVFGVKSDWKKNPDGTYDVDGDVSPEQLRPFIKNGKLTIKFNKVTRNFFCFDLGLTSLEGSPKEVGRNFNCSGNKLISLEGAPEKVGRDFSCYDNQLTSLEGAPKEVMNSFNCSFNELTSLKGALGVYWGINCSHNKLTSFEGCPRVRSWFKCSDNQLTSLKGAPKVDHGFNCSHNKLTSLEGCPEKLNGWFDCSNNELTSLEGGPKEACTFRCANNKLTSLKGCPKVEVRFDCSNNELTSLEGAPEKVSMEFNCRNNPGKFTKEDVEKVCKVSGEIVNMSLKIINYTKLIADRARQIKLANFSEITENKETNSESDDLKRQILASIKDYIKIETGKDVFLDSDKFDRFFEDMLWDAEHGKFNKEINSGEAPSNFANGYYDDSYDDDSYEDDPYAGFTDEQKELATKACFIVSNLNYAGRYPDRFGAGPSMDHAYEALGGVGSVINKLFDFKASDKDIDKHTVEMVSSMMDKIRSMKNNDYSDDSYEDSSYVGFTDEEKELATKACFIIYNLNYAGRYPDRIGGLSMDHAYEALRDVGSVINEVFDFKASDEDIDNHTVWMVVSMMDKIRDMKKNPYMFGLSRW